MGDDLGGGKKNRTHMVGDVLEYGGNGGGGGGVGGDKK